MYMIEIILLNQSKLSLLGVIRQIPLHAQFRVTLFDNFNDISTFTTTHYTNEVFLRVTNHTGQADRYGSSLGETPHYYSPPEFTVP